MTTTGPSNSMSVVLKVRIMGSGGRDQSLELTLDSETLDYGRVRAELQSLWPSREGEGEEPYVAKYVDEEGDVCTLVPASFSDFLTTARRAADSLDGPCRLELSLLVPPSGSCSQALPLPIEIGRHVLPPSSSSVAEMASDTCSEASEASGGWELLMPSVANLSWPEASEGEAEGGMEAEGYGEQELKDMGTERAEESEGQGAEEGEAEEALLYRDAAADADIEPHAEMPAASPDSAPVSSLSSSSLGSGSSEDLEALVMARRARSACEEELKRHLRSWLQSQPLQEANFTSWLAAVHPENISSDGSLDARLYFEDGAHWKIWQADVEAQCSAAPCEDRTVHRDSEPSEGPGYELDEGAQTRGMSPTGSVISCEMPALLPMASASTPSVLGSFCQEPNFSLPVPVVSESQSLGVQVGSTIYYTLSPRAAGEEPGGGESPSEASAQHWPESATASEAAEMAADGTAEQRRAQGGTEVPAAPAQDCFRDQKYNLFLEAAASFIAHSLPLTALKLKVRRHFINGLAGNMTQETKDGFALLAAVLRDSGEGYDAAADVAERLAEGRTRHGDGMADLTAAAARLPLPDRLVFSRAFCACCPRSLLHVLPPWFVLPVAASSAALHVLTRDVEQKPQCPVFGGFFSRQVDFCQTLRDHAMNHAFDARQMAMDYPW